MNIESCIHQLDALIALRKFDDAENLILSLPESLYENVYFAAHYARIAMYRGDWPEAVRRWQNIRDNFPGHPVPLVGLGEALRESGELEPAEATFATAVRAAEAFPDFEWAAISYADLASRRGEWDTALARWSAAKARAPSYAPAWCREAESLVQLGRIGEAERLLVDALSRFPTNEDILVQYAAIATMAANWEEAARRWTAVLKQHRGNLQAHRLAADALINMGRSEQARDILKTASILFPDELSLEYTLKSLDRNFANTTKWAKVQRAKRRGGFSAYLSIFNDSDLLRPALESIAPLLDELVVVDGAYRWMLPFLHGIGRDPQKSGSRVYEAIDAVGIPFRVISDVWESESEKRRAGFDSCRTRFVCRVDADEIMFLDEEMFDLYFRADAGVGQMAAPLYLSPGWIAAPISEILPLAGFLFDSNKINSADHLRYLWLISDQPGGAASGEIFPEPIAFNAHLTHWRTPSTAVNRAAFYVLNYVRNHGVRWFPDSNKPIADLSDLFQRIDPRIFAELMKGTSVVVGYGDVRGGRVSRSPLGSTDEKSFCYLFENYLKSLVEANWEVRQNGRYLIEQTFLDLTSPEAQAALTSTNSLSLRFTDKIDSARVVVTRLLPEAPWEILDEITSSVDGDTLSFDIPAVSGPPFLRRILQIQASCRSAYPVQQFFIQS